MNNYLGIGLQFPINLVGGASKLIRDNELIEQSIIDILNTPVGTRFFLPQYGSRLRELIFESNDDVLIDLMHVFIAEALKKWEKRVSINNAEFDVRDAQIDCYITYTILKKNEVHSLIFPFYRKLTV